MFCVPKLFQSHVLCTKAFPKSCFVYPSFSKVMFCVPKLFKSHVLFTQAFQKSCFVHPGFSKVMFWTRKFQYLGHNAGHCNTSHLQLIEGQIKRKTIQWPTKNYLDNGPDKQHWHQVLTKDISWISKQMAWSRSQPCTGGYTSFCRSTEHTDTRYYTSRLKLCSTWETRVSD